MEITEPYRIYRVDDDNWGSLYRVVRVVQTISRETDLRLIAICRTRAEAKALVEELKS